MDRNCETNETLINFLKEVIGEKQNTNLQPAETEGKGGLDTEHPYSLFAESKQLTDGYIIKSRYGNKPPEDEPTLRSLSGGLVYEAVRSYFKQYCSKHCGHPQFSDTEKYICAFNNIAAAAASIGVIRGELDAQEVEDYFGFNEDDWE